MFPELTDAEADRVIGAVRAWDGMATRLAQGLKTVPGARLLHPVDPELTVLAMTKAYLGPPPPALGRVPSVDRDIAPLIAFLGSDGANALTGTTLVADGGNWMVP